MRVLSYLVLFFASLFLLVACTARKDHWQHDMHKRMKTYGPYAQRQLEPFFKKAGVHYPPQKITLLAYKKSKQLQLWASDHDKWHYIRSYKILAASGHSGPKLHSGDRQVPEGIYSIKSFNPDSRFKLSMQINYPNKFDKVHAKADKRTNLGKNIFIHGKHTSVGCLAVGDPAIEELFVLAKLVGKKHIDVIISPHVFYNTTVAQNKLGPPWVQELYEKIKTALLPFRRS